MDYKRYRRYFIILDREDSGFDNKPGKSPKGYTKIEIKNGKGILSHFVQNLKYDEKEPYIYRGYLVGTAGNQPIYADSGSIVIDQQGKGELNWRFDPENVDGKGNPIDAFNVIAIVGEKLGSVSAAVTAPLVGFMDKKKVPWKNAFMGKLSSQSQGAVEKAVEPIREKLNVEIEKTETEDIHLLKRMEEDIEKVSVAEAVPEEIIEKASIIETAPEQNIEKPLVVEIASEENRAEDAPEAVKEEEIIEKAEIRDVDEEKEKRPETSYPLESIFEKPIEEMEAKTVKIEEEQTAEEPEISKTEAAEGKIQEQELHQMAPPHRGIFNQYQNLESEQMKYYRTKTSQHYNQQNFKMAVNYVKNILKHYEKTEPFESNLEGYQWWKVPSSPQTMQRGFPPFYGYVSNMYTYYPYMNHMTGYPDLIYKYQHYIFGLKVDENDEPVYFVYGVPGKFALSEQPYEGMTGFVYWHSIQDKEAKLGDDGYWILHIDARTGSVAMPLKPTPPPGY